MTQHVPDGVLDRISKLLAMADNEATGPEEAAAFTAKVQELLIQHRLSEMDVRDHQSQDDNPIGACRIQAGGLKSRRCEWQENLAGYLAQAYFCQLLVTTGTNQVTLVGRRFDLNVASKLYLHLVGRINTLADKAYGKYFRSCSDAGIPEQARGYRTGFINAFVHTIGFRLHENRKKILSTIDDDKQLVRRAEKEVEDWVQERGVSAGKASDLEGKQGSMEGEVHGARAGEREHLAGNLLDHAETKQQRRIRR